MRRTTFLVLAAVVACGSDDSASQFDGGGDDGPPQGDAGPTFTLRVDPTTAKATLVLGTPPPPLAFHAFEKDVSGTETDVTGTVAWSVDDPLLGSMDATGNLKPAGIGGKSRARATLGGVTATADVVFELTGDVYTGGTDPSSKTKFGTAAVDPDPKNAPLLEYPEDGVILPGNLPAVEVQFSQAADNNLYRAHFVAADVLDVYVYSTAREIVPPASAWTAITGSVHDLPVTWTVEALGPTNQLRTSAPRTLTVTSDTIDQSAIYVWQSSTGSFHVIDITQAKDFPLPTTAPELQGGQPCSGCHRISRDGKRFSYTYNGGNFEFGALVYDATAKSYVPKITPSVSVRATYATFNPNESTQIPAMLVTVPDNVPQNTAGTVRLELHDPDTNTVVPNNLPAMIAQLGAVNPGRATSMPDWAPDGSFVVFSSIVEAPVSYGGGTFTFGTPKVLVAADSNANPDTGENDLLPAVSPDGAAVAFTRASGWWSIKSQVSLLNLSGQIMLVRRSDGQVIELKNGSNGAGTTLSSTWPQWAPTIGSKYAWLAYASERSYGHELTPANKSCGALVQGQGSCKQLWVMAIDTTKMKSGTLDPSAAPFWIPGQSIHAQYVSPQWTKAVLTPPN
jgi:hypothetical protein